MSQNDTGRAGVVHAPSDGNGMDKLASAILDDLLYNVIHDLIMKTHRDEKQSRSSTAAIRVETLAHEAAQDLAGATGESRPEGHHETDAAEYENGQVSLKGNPLKTTTDILCPRCHLPRLLYPIDGIGARKPDPNITYCKKHPYINKPGCDIYGQMWVAPGPGRGKKKKDFDKKVSAAISAATTGIDNGTGTAAEQRPPNVLSFPSATCSKCKRCILVSRLNNHMGSCIGNSGRNASRAAAAKISNGGNGSNGSSMVADNTPPASQKGTPLSSSHGSPRKRDADDFDDDGGYDDGDAHGSSYSSKPTKKKFKSSASGSGTGNTASPSQGLSVSLSKKLTLKMKNASGSSSRDTSVAPTTHKKNVPKGKPSSSFGGGRKISDNYDDDDDEDAFDDDNDEEDNDNSRDYIDDGGDDDYSNSNSNNNSNSHRGSQGGYGSSNGGNRHRGGSTKRDADDDDNDSDVRGTINYKAASASAGNALKMKKKKLLASSAAKAMSAGSSPLKKTTKVPIPIPGANGNHKKLKVVSKTPLSPPASKNGRARDMDAGSESSGTMSSPRN